VIYTRGEKMAKINKTKYALLGVLSIMSGSGYDIKKFCDSSIGYFWNENYGHIYPMLQKMEQEELITKEVQQTEGRPAKNIYSITQKGRDELKAWLMLPVEQEPGRSEFLLKIFLSKDLPINSVIGKIQKVKDDCEKDLKVFSEIEEVFESGNTGLNKKELILYLSTVKYGRACEEAKLKWCDETMKVLKDIEN
jgi:DNA-binding PadR family transcriptional regulator